MKRFLAAFLFTVPFAAHADSWFQFESGLGITHYDTENGRWYQNGEPQNNVTANAPEFSIGAAGPLLTHGAWGIDWHVDYVTLGRSAASCMCDTSDADYAAGTTKYRAFFSGSGRAQGIAATIEAYRWLRGWRLGVDVGAYVYHEDWHENVAGWTVGGPPVDLSLSSHMWSVAPVAGVSIGEGVWSVSYRHYFMKFHRAAQNVPPLWNDADVLEVKRRF